jgi:hypothetical protein
MNQPDSPFYTVRGARPRPLLPADGAGGTGRPTLILAAMMLGWLFLLIALAAFAGGSGSTTAPPQTINRGVVVKPAPGWASAADVWKVGPGAVSLKRAGAVVAFAADAYDGTNEALLAGETAQLKGQFASFRSLSPSDLTVAGGLPAVSTLFSGTAQGGQLEGELVAVAHGGTGVVILAIAPFGQLRRVQGDIDAMLRTLVIP